MKLSKNIAPKPDKYSENFDFFYLGALATTRVPHMFPPVFPRSFAAFWNKIQMSREIPYFGRSLKMSCEKA